jgi:heat-inducible transcriptional repressor
VAVVQYPSLSRSAVRHIELVSIAPQRVLLVLITDNGRVEQATVDLPEIAEPESIAHLRAVLNACLDGHKLADAAKTVAGLGERVPVSERPNAAAVFTVLLGSLADRHEERVVIGGTANLAAPDFSKGLRDVLEALEEQVVLMRLLGEAASPSALTVRIGAETGLQGTSVISAAYGTRGQAVAKLGVLGPTRMDYPGTMGAVRAVARYVGRILGEA